MGAQLPSFHVCPPYSFSHGDLAYELCAAYGLVLDPWQRSVLRDWLARDGQGRLVNVTAGLMAPRQNGKTGLFVARAFFGALVVGESVLYTAHEYASARKFFERITAGLFGTEPNDPSAPYRDLNARLRKVWRSAGQMIVELKGGASIEVKTRTDSGGRGLTKDLLVLDEAQELTDSQLDAVGNVTTAAPLGSPQTIYAGTPPSAPGKASVFDRLHAAVHERADGFTCWHEWGVAEVGDVADVERWYATNPALGIRISEQTVAMQARTMSKEGFARERLGWWPTAARVNPIQPREWEACLERDPAPDGDVFFAARFTPRGTYAVAAALLSEGRPVHVEVVMSGSTRGSLESVASFLEARAASARGIAVSGVQGAPMVRTSLQASRAAVKALCEPNARQEVEAVSMFADAVSTRGVTHFGQEGLTASALGCVRRPSRDGGWTFAPTEDADSAPVEAAALAYWRAATAPPKKKRGKAKLL